MQRNSVLAWPWQRLLLVAFLAAGPSTSTAQSPSKLTGTVDLAIGSGSSESREPYLFQDVSGLHFGTEGKILAATAQEHAVRAFSRAGVFLYQFGKRGKGPGDLDSPCCLAFDASGRLWVVDVGNRRFAIFIVNGSGAQFQKTISLPSGPSGLMNRVEWSIAGRPILVSTFRDANSGQFGSIRMELTESGNVVSTDTVAMPRRDSLAEQAVERSMKDGGRSGRGVSVISQPFGPRALRAFGPGGAEALAVSSNYAITLLDGKLRRTALITRRVPPVIVSPAERERAEKTLAGAAKANGVPRSAIRLTVPKVKPPLRAVGFDLDGRLWVQRSVRDGAPNEADVFDAKGVFLLTATWPADVDLSYWAIRGREGLGIRVDADGVQQPVRLIFR